MTKRLRRWYWTWRFNVWRRRLVRVEVKLKHSRYFSSSDLHWDQRRAVKIAIEKVELFEKLLGTDMPKLRLIQGGKSDAG